MGEFWTAMTPWLLMVLGLPLGVGLHFLITPSDERAEEWIRSWAESAGLELQAIEPARGIDGLNVSNCCKAFRVSVRDWDGSEHQGRAIVGLLMLGGEGRNLSIRWDKPS